MSSQDPDDAVASLWKQWLGLDSHQYRGEVGSSPIPASDTMVSSSLFCTNQPGRLQNSPAASFFMIKLEQQKILSTFFLFFLIKPGHTSDGKTCYASHRFDLASQIALNPGIKKILTK